MAVSFQGPLVKKQKTEGRQLNKKLETAFLFYLLRSFQCEAKFKKKRAGKKAGTQNMTKKD